MTDDIIMGCYIDLAISITVQECKEYYSKLLRKKTYASSNRQWFLKNLDLLRTYLLTDSWMAKMGADMEFIVLELERRAEKGEPMAWKRVVDTANNVHTKKGSKV